MEYDKTFLRVICEILCYLFDFSKTDILTFQLSFFFTFIYRISKLVIMNPNFSKNDPQKLQILHICS